MLEAERVAAVGQAVAGLARGIKNILTGMEGSIYMMQSGLRRGQASRVEHGVGMLQRNVGKISTLVRDLLAFSKGSEPHVTWSDPNQLAREVVELYDEMARKAGIDLRIELQPGLPPAPLDASGIHTCLANLISNAIDACKSSLSGRGSVRLKVSEDRAGLSFEVFDDGCGMDYEVRTKIFTTFFTTKGSGGTGLGRLMTRKIVQEHGGRIELTRLEVDRIIR
jgi:signal transduction histidine kinase